MLRLVEFISSFVNQQACCLDLHRHISQHKLDALEGSDWFAKLLAFPGIGTCRFKCSLCDTYCYSANIDTSAIECRKRNFKALPILTDTVSNRKLAIGKDQFPGRR